MMVNYNVRKIGKIGIPLFFFFLLFIAGAVDVTAASTIVVSKTSPACTTSDVYVCYSTIQAAVDNANDGDEIIVCPGTYVENILVDKRLSIRSENGPDSTIVQAKKPDNDVFEVTAHYVGISGFTVKDAKGGGSASGIHLHYADYCNISNNNCSNNSNGIYAYDSSNTTIEKNIIFSNNYGIFLISSFDNSIKNNDISSNRARGIYLARHSSNNLIRHNVVKSNYQGGILLISSGYNTIEKNIVPSNNGDGITVSESDNNIIKNNTACENEYCGINLRDSSGNEISHNVVNNNVLGIESIYGSNNTITNNSVSCLFHSIKLEHSFNNIIRGNNITNNKWGILLHLHSFNNTLRNNVVKSNYFEGIELDSSSGNNTIVKNIVSNNGDGIRVDSYSNIIKDNTVTSNDRVGIELLNSSYNIIKNNTANSNGEGGVILSTNSSHNTVEVNTANSNDCFGIKLENSSYNIIKNNTAKSNNGEGIALYISNHNIITDNTANSNKRGIELGGRIDDIDENAVIHGTGSHNNSIENNIASNNKEGINLLFSGNNTIKSNIASNNKEGINLGSSCNNTIKNNIVSSNRDGIHISFSDNNIVENNIASNNHGIAESGICLAFSAKNILKNNIVSSNNGNGIRLSGAYHNILWNNHISLNHFSGIYHLLYSNNNAFYHNNIIDNTIQVKAEGSSLNNYWYQPYLLEGNYWSDYNGTDVNGDGIGDTEIPHPSYPCVDIDYDNYPYMNKSGWLSFLVLPEYWDFGTVYQGEIVQQTFTMQNAFVYNKGQNDLNILSITSEPDVGISDVKPSIKIPKGYSKTFDVTIDTTNMKGHILRTIEIRSEDIVTPNKTVLIYGIVTPPRHEIRIKNVDFQSRAIRGQITLFNITIENRGDFREKNVSIEIKEEDKTRDSTMIEIIDHEEAKSAIVKWNTNNVSLGIHDVTIKVLNKDQKSLANITVTVTVLAPSQAKTLIVTNHERLEGIEDNLIRLSHHPSVNGIILDVGKDKRCSEAYKSFDSYPNSGNANNIAQAIKDLIDATREVYKNIDYLLIVGNDEVIPFYRIQDKSLESYVGSYGLYDEKDYIERYEQLKPATTIGSAFWDNMYLTDDFYANFESEDLPDGFDGELYIPEIPIGRLVETPQEISKTIDVFSKKGDIVEPQRIFVTSYDFMNDAGGSCASVWSTLSTPVFMGKGIEEHGTYSDTSEIINELLNKR